MFLHVQLALLYDQCGLPSVIYLCHDRKASLKCFVELIGKRFYFLVFPFDVAFLTSFARLRIVLFAHFTIKSLVALPHV